MKETIKNFFKLLFLPNNKKEYYEFENKYYNQKEEKLNIHNSYQNELKNTLNDEKREEIIKNMEMNIKEYENATNEYVLESTRLLNIYIENTKKQAILRISLTFVVLISLYIYILF
jgi:hypothetical protein